MRAIEDASEDASERSSARVSAPLGFFSNMLRRVEDRLNDVNDAYAFELRPEYRVKVRKSVGATAVGMTFDARARRYAVAVKGARRARDDETRGTASGTAKFWGVMKKVVFEPEERRVEAFTQRVAYGALSLRAIGTYDGESGEWGLRWQLQTFHKEKKRLRSAELELSDRVRACMRWDVSSAAPEVEGKIGSHEKFAFDVDVGSYHISVPRLELKVDL